MQRHKTTLCVFFFCSCFFFLSRFVHFKNINNGIRRHIQYIQTPSMQSNVGLYTNFNEVCNIWRMEMVAAAATEREREDRENADELTSKLWWSIFVFFFSFSLCFCCCSACYRLSTTVFFFLFFMCFIFSSSSLLLSYSNIFDGWWRMNYNRIWRGRTRFGGEFSIVVYFSFICRILYSLSFLQWSLRRRLDQSREEITNEICLSKFGCLKWQSPDAEAESRWSWSKQTHNVWLFYDWTLLRTYNLQF